jgi:hypothetical protein
MPQDQRPDRGRPDAGRPVVRTNRELRALLRAAPRTPGRVTALAELVQREPRGINRTLTELALDDTLDQPMRVEAAAALGREATPSALEGLRAIIGVDDEVVAQQAIERLGKVGSAADLEVLRAVRTGNATTQRVLRAAKCFLSYRHRLGAYRVDTPKQRVAATPAATELITGAPTKAMRSRFEIIPPRVPGISLGTQPLRRLQCRTRELAVLVDESVVAAGPASMLERQAAPVVITRYNTETGVDDPAYYVLTDPQASEAFRIVGVRPSGRAAWHGTGTVAGTTVTFEVNATEQPIDHPLTVSGRYGSTTSTLRFDVALVDPTYSDAQQGRRRKPRPIT